MPATPWTELTARPVGDVDGGQQLEPGLALTGRVTGGGAVTAIAHPVAHSGPSCGSPASPDFSGWNWVADSGPFSTAATNRVAVRAPR